MPGGHLYRDPTGGAEEVMVFLTVPDTLLSASACLSFQPHRVGNIHVTDGKRASGLCHFLPQTEGSPGLSIQALWLPSWSLAFPTCPVRVTGGWEQDRVLGFGE